MEALKACLEILPAKQRKIVQMRYDGGLSVNAIAEQIKKTANNVSMILTRTRRALSGCVRKKMGLVPS